MAVAKKFLDKELEKCDSWEALNESIKGLTDNEHFQQLKQKGVGQTTILKFLGGNWKQWRIQEALKELNDKEVARDVAEV